MKKKLLIIFLLISGFIKAEIFWQPYPINVIISSNGTLNRLECSVYDSVLGSWSYYNTPYFNSIIDTSTSGGPEGIVVFMTYFPLSLNSDIYYGFITYDPILHQFAPEIRTNPDPDAPGAWIWFNDGVVGVKEYCCQWGGAGSGSGFFDVQVEAYIYDINIHSWKGGIVETGHAPDQPIVSLSLGLGGYLKASYNDDLYNPMKTIQFYSPASHVFKGSFYYWGWSLIGNQDLQICNYDMMLSNTSYSVSTYDPLLTFNGFSQDSSRPDLLGKQIIYFHDTQNAIIFFGIYDEYLHTWVKDTITDSLSIVNIKENVVAYSKPNNSPLMLYYQVYSIQQHQWIKDSTQTNGIVSLNIINGTVKWSDNNGVQHKAGYDEATGWGNYDTPLLLQCNITDVFDSTGVPLIFVRNFSIGTDSVRFHFSDGITTPYRQGSAWHQFKINGSYSYTPNDTMEICIETVTSLGVQIACTTHVFSTPLAGGVASVSDSLICAGDTIMLTVTGHNGSVQWQENTDSVNNWVDITLPGFDSDTLYLVPLSNTLYRAKIFDGINTFAFSNISFVKLIPNVIPYWIYGDDSICQGYSITLGVDSFPGALSFNWSLPFNWLGNSTNATIEITNAPNSATVSVTANTVCGITALALSKYITIRSLDTAVTYFQSNNELIADLWNASSYQWVTCPSMQPIPGAVWDIFQPTQSGSYALIVSYEGCTDTSNCHDVIVVGLEEDENSPSVELFPSPATETININCFNLPFGEYEVTILNAFGQNVQTTKFKITSGTFHSSFDLSTLSQGVYFLNLNSDKFNKVMRVEKK